MRWPKAYRLRRPFEFAAVQAAGRRLRGAHVVCIARHVSGAPSRVGLTVSRKVGNAVIRNRVRRRLRACLSARYAALPPGTEIVVVARRSAARVDFRALDADVAQCLARLPGAAAA